MAVYKYNSGQTAFSEPNTRRTSYYHCHHNQDNRALRRKVGRIREVILLFREIDSAAIVWREPETRASVSEAATAAAMDGTVPEDIAPLLKNLSAILTKDEPMCGDAFEANEVQVSIPETPTTASTPTFVTSPSPPSPPPPTHTAPDNHAAATIRPRRNTVAVLSSSRSIGHGLPSETRFPLREKRYPFTFKLLLHKLYDLEEWAAKVQQVLAASQEQFRSLNSAPPPVAISTGGGDSRGGNNNNNNDLTRSPGSPPPLVDGPRFPTPSSAPQNLFWTRLRRADNARCLPSRPQSSRAVKKRIVNRRRSTNGLGVEKKGEWMYDAAVSSVDTENADARGHESLRRRKRVFSSVNFVDEREDLSVAI
ncbi:hypothetical protein BGW80DRAFT_1561466 [Lactifluus volemus]|nr:hypothetical protein BGW80DRAFT_1561466 [Lactifluus volemus]